MSHLAIAPPTQPSQAPAPYATLDNAAPVLGDGTTARSRARSRWRAARWPVAVVLTLVLVGLLAAVLKPRTSTVAYAPDNPTDLGGRALAEILRDQGVEVDFVQTSAEALALAAPGDTLLVAGTYPLTDKQVRLLGATEADLVVVEPEYAHLDMLSGGALSTATSYEYALSEADCADPDARAAERIESSGSGLAAHSADVVTCFPTVDGGASAYAVLDDGSHRLVVLDDIGLLTNARLADDGNAALLLRTLGHNEHLVWYLPTWGDTGEEVAAGGGRLLPTWTGPLTAQLLLIVLVLALWRGRALGRIVTEPLPVTVRAAETTLGRGRLYRRSRSRGHAAAALRAGMARRAAARLGLPPSAGATDVIDALARATGYSTEQVAGLLYGPPPIDDAGLLQLARQLDKLESEVHRT